jgi:hypothetical protein
MMGKAAPAMPAGASRAKGRCAVVFLDIGPHTSRVVFKSLSLPTNWIAAVECAVTDRRTKATALET